MATLDYYGHATFGLTTDDGTRVIIDPFFGDNPWTGVDPSEVEADFIFCTHGPVVIPIHYNTWPYIEQDVEAFRALVGDRALVEIVEPGKGSYEF